MNKVMCCVNLCIYYLLREDLLVYDARGILNMYSWIINKPKGLKVAKEDQRPIGSMIKRLDG